MASVLASALRLSMSCSLACSLEMPESCSSFSICCLRIFSMSSCFWATISFCFESASCSVWRSCCFFWSSSKLLLICCSFCRTLDSAALIFWVRELMSFSHSAFMARNFSLACSILSFFITSACASASEMIFEALFLKAVVRSNHVTTAPKTRQAAHRLTVSISIF